MICLVTTLQSVLQRLGSSSMYIVPVLSSDVLSGVRIYLYHSAAAHTST